MTSPRCTEADALLAEYGLPNAPNVKKNVSFIGLLRNVRRLGRHGCGHGLGLSRAAQERVLHAFKTALEQELSQVEPSDVEGYGAFEGVNITFTVKPPPDCVNVEMNYADNPYFPVVLEAERKHAKNTMKAEAYAHIWEGKCKPAVEGAIYFDQMAQADARIGSIPHDGQLKTHAVWDLGFNDSMAIILAQRVSSEVRVIGYVEGVQRTLADYSDELRALRLDGQPINWGSCFLPHDGFAKRHQSGKKARGASTITQQLAKNLFLSGSRSDLRKGQELIIAYMLETLMDKRRIFEIYLNVVEFGRGVYGAEAAARHYFRTPAASLAP